MCVLKLWFVQYISLIYSFLFLIFTDFSDPSQTGFPDFQTELHAANQELAYPGGMSAGVPSDPESEGGASPDHALRLWMQEVKSEHSSCLSSRANSVLSLTDTEQERKSEPENGTRLFHVITYYIITRFL